MQCRYCGCTEVDPCPEGCSWTLPNLCSLCALFSHATTQNVINFLAMSHLGSASREEIRHSIQRLTSIALYQVEKELDQEAEKPLIQVVSS